MSFAILVLISLILLIPLTIYILLDKLKKVKRREAKIEKKIDKIKLKFGRLTAKLEIKKKKDLAKNQEPAGPKGLHQSSVKCILSFMDSSKRLCLSLFYPKIRPIEKTIPLVLTNLKITSFEFEIDEIRFEFNSHRPICSLVSKKGAESQLYVTVSEFDHRENHSDVISKICVDLFAGRTQFEVTRFEMGIPISLGMDFKVHGAIVKPHLGYSASTYSSITQKIEDVLFIGLNEPEDLRLPWVRNVKVLESIAGDCHLFVNELRNMLARKICIDCSRKTHNCVDLIIQWCKNSKRPVGSELILTMSHSEEQKVFSQVFASRELAEIGFVPYGEKILGLIRDDNSEVILAAVNDSRVFSIDYLDKANPWHYLHLKVTDSKY